MIWKMTPNPLSSEHPQTLKIMPPTVRLDLAVKKEIPRLSHEPPLGSDEVHLNMTGTEKKESVSLKVSIPINWLINPRIFM